MKIRKITLISVLIIILHVSKEVIAAIPGIELVSLLIALYTIHLKKDVLYIISIFVLLQGISYGFGIWWFSYIYIWFILAIFAYIFRNIENKFIWAIILGVYGLLFGTFTSLVYLCMGKFSYMISYIISGLKFDIIHGIGNFFVALILFDPLNKLFKKLFIKIN